MQSLMCMVQEVAELGPFLVELMTSRLSGARLSSSGMAFGAGSLGYKDSVSGPRTAPDVYRYL